MSSAAFSPIGRHDGNGAQVNFIEKAAPLHPVHQDYWHCTADKYYQLEMGLSSARMGARAL